MPSFFLSFVLCNLARVASKGVQELQLEDASDSLNLIQLPARKLSQTPDTDPVLTPTKLQEQREPFRRSLGLAPEGTKILDRYKACPLHAYPFNNKAAAFVHEASRTHFVHIFKNAGSVIHQSINRTGAQYIAGYSDPQPDVMRYVLNGTDRDKWFTAAIVRDPLRRSLDAFHEVFKRVQCSPPIGFCGSGAQQGFKDPVACQPCLESNPVQAIQWIEAFKELLPNIQKKVDAGEGLYGHMFPQLSYLTYPDGSKVNVDYLGSMEDNPLESEYDFIFNTQESLANVSASAHLEGSNLFRINASLLSDDLVVQVCHTYYADYCCFGFEFPDACKKAGLACTFQLPRATSLAQTSQEAIPFGSAMVPGWHRNMTGVPWHHNMTGMPSAPPAHAGDSIHLLHAPLYSQLLLSVGVFLGIKVAQTCGEFGICMFIIALVPAVSCCCRWDKTSEAKKGGLQEPLDIPIPSRTFASNEKETKTNSNRWNVIMFVCSWSCVFRMMLLWSATVIRMEWHRRQIMEAFLVESCMTSFVCWTWARWEDVGHYLTLWIFLGAIMCLPLVDILFQDFLMFMVYFCLLLSSQALYLVTHFTSNSSPRLPPFEVKQLDSIQSDCGWLGEKMCNYIRSPRLRIAITSMWEILDMASSSQLLLLFVATLPSFQIPTQNLNRILVVLLTFTALWNLRMFFIYFLAIQSMYKAFTNKDESSTVYNTGDYEVAAIDGDRQAMTDLKAHGRQSTWPSLTVILPCYMPIEEPIIMDVLGWYRKQSEEYPGQFFVMVVWNSPSDHPVISEKLSALCMEWPSLSVHRHHLSISKADNLNLAVGLLKTDIVLVNDADTIVSAASMCRAAMHIHMGNFDVAQCWNTHCLNDYQGTPDGKDRGCFWYQPVIAWVDAFPGTLISKNYYDRCPFNGRGGFWRVDALKAVGFDHRTVAEDHDAFERGAALHGFRGTLDINMLCQERLPPTCSSFLNQRIRWKNGNYQLRRNLPMMFRSARITLFEKICEAAGTEEKLLFLEICPLRAVSFLTFLACRTWMFQLIYIGDAVLPSDPWLHLHGHVPYMGVVHLICQEFDPATIVFMIYLIVEFSAMLCRLVTDMMKLKCTRYTPAVFSVVFKLLVLPLTDIAWKYIQGTAHHQYLWGGAQFIPTIRKTTQKSSNPEDICKLEQRSSNTKKI